MLCKWYSPVAVGLLLLVQGGWLSSLRAQTLPGTLPLEMNGDLASELVDGVDRFLLRKLNDSIGTREAFWERDLSSPEAYERSLESKRERLSHILGVRDERVPFESPEIVSTVENPGLLAAGRAYSIYRVRWPAFGDVSAEGLLLEPNAEEEDRGGVLNVVALPDADQSPEQLAGLSAGIPVSAQFARRLAENGCRVLVPALVSREMQRRHSPGRRGGANLTHREYLYRSAFELGRHIVGYEIQKVLAGVDWFSANRQAGDSIGVMGYGEGGMLALYAGAIDTRIDRVCVSGYFDRRERLWEQPISRNVFGLLEQYGDAELAAMIAPRSLIVEASRGPEVRLPSEGGAPAVLSSPQIQSVRAEWERARGILAESKFTDGWLLVANQEMNIGTDEALSAFLGREIALVKGPREGLNVVGKMPDNSARQRRLIHELDRHSQQLLVESPYVRKAFMEGLSTESLSEYEESVKRYRDYFYEDVIGRFDEPLMPFNARSRKAYDEELWTGYEVVLDVFPDVFAYGILCLPKGMSSGERRPVVVCQHGLEGRPQMIVSGDHGAYHDFAAKLAERGFITFSPQNLYIFRDRFRSLQRKANPLKKTLFSVIVPQHQQIVHWLKKQDFVDPNRIAFYGLSYGGKTAMRVPAIITDYCLSICSADFNEWVWKNASTRSPYSYVWTGEYEIFEFDLGSTFNYAEMAALIAPRPFMVERGHFDGVAPDETVGYEFGKVRHLYAARLGIPERCEIEWFKGPHTINGKGTYDFLHRHLQWPRP